MGGDQSKVGRRDKSEAEEWIDDIYQTTRFGIWRGDRCLGREPNYGTVQFSSRTGVIGGQEGIGYEIWRSMKMSEGGRGQGRKLAFMDTGRRETGLQGKTGSAGQSRSGRGKDGSDRRLEWGDG